MSLPLKGGRIYGTSFHKEKFCKFRKPCPLKVIARLNCRKAGKFYAFCCWTDTCNQKTEAPIAVDAPKISIIATLRNARIAFNSDRIATATSTKGNKPLNSAAESNLR